MRYSFMKLVEIKPLKEGADWIILKSLPGNQWAVNEYEGNIFKWKDMAGDDFEANSKEWQKLYKKLDKNDKKTIDGILADRG